MGPWTWQKRYLPTPRYPQRLHLLSLSGSLGPACPQWQLKEFHPAAQASIWEDNLLASAPKASLGCPEANQDLAAGTGPWTAPGALSVPSQPREASCGDIWGLSVQ